MHNKKALNQDTWPSGKDVTEIGISKNIWNQPTFIESDLDLPISEDQQIEIASVYGPEYNTALSFYLKALKDNRSDDLSLAYAENEVGRMGYEVDTAQLKEVISTYL